MAHVLFSDTDDWELFDDDQDLRGWEVRDANGATVGRVGDMAVDTDRQVVDTIILEDGTRFRAEDVTLSDGVVYVTTYGAPAGIATRSYTDAHSVRRAAPVAGPPSEVAREQAEAHREVAEERAEMRREMHEPDRAEEIREGRREVAEERAEGRQEVADARHDASGFGAYEDDFRSHYRDAYGDLDFVDYSPAYRYGYDVAYDDRYTGRDFGDAEADLREAYYRRFGYPMSDNIVWSRVKGAVRYAYERARAATR